VRELGESVWHRARNSEEEKRASERDGDREREGVSRGKGGCGGWCISVAGGVTVVEASERRRKGSIGGCGVN